MKGGWLATRGSFPGQANKNKSLFSNYFKNGENKCK
jgi:hypothetical protein